MIKCLVLGGQPSPAVTWWRDHQIVDDSFDQTSQFKVTNLLTIPALRRSDLHSILTCQAKNNNESVPVSTSVKLDMTCKCPGGQIFKFLACDFQLDLRLSA